MNRPRYVRIIQGVFALVAALFGLATIIAGARVLAGSDPGYIVFRPLLIYNTAMGVQKIPQGNLFYYGINMDNRIRAHHPLRRVKQLIDFDFAYQEVKDLYGANGNVSVPPAVILKLMLLLVLYNIRSERELMATVPERLDWLWFLDYDLDTEIPNHSVLSKARNKWGVEVFRSFFERIVVQCSLPRAVMW